MKIEVDVDETTMSYLVGVSNWQGSTPEKCASDYLTGKLMPSRSEMLKKCDVCGAYAEHWVAFSPVSTRLCHDCMAELDGYVVQNSDAKQRAAITAVRLGCADATLAVQMIMEWERLVTDGLNELLKAHDERKNT